MKISFKGDYALKIILDLAMTYGQGITPIKEISKRQDIPERFLEQIVTILKGGHYIKTVRGPKGGIYLAKDPAKITMGEIIRLIEGPTSPIACVSKTGYARCDFEDRCAFRGVFAQIRDRINDVIDRTTFADMIVEANKLDTMKNCDYSI